MKESKNSQHLVIPVDILNLVYSRLVSCMVFPTKIIENMRKCRNAVTVNQELNFFKKAKKSWTQNPLHYYFGFYKKAVFLQRYWNE